MIGYTNLKIKLRDAVIAKISALFLAQYRKEAYKDTIYGLKSSDIQLSECSVSSSNKNWLLNHFRANLKESSAMAERMVEMIEKVEVKLVVKKLERPIAEFFDSRAVPFS